jgi:hypothetical protein
LTFNVKNFICVDPGEKTTGARQKINNKRELPICYRKG